MSKKASLLSNHHRELLMGEKDIQRPSDERSIRSTMRQRIRAGMADFTLLFELLPPADREKTFRGERAPSKGEESGDQFTVDRDLGEGSVDPALPYRFFSGVVDVFIRTKSELEQGMVDTVAFLYIAARDAGIEPKNLIELGVTRAEERLNDGSWLINSVDLEVDKDVQHTLAKRALRNISEGEELTNAQVRALLESGRGNITPEQIQGYVRGEWEPDESEFIDPASGV
jgi:hypothetical protein